MLFALAESSIWAGAIVVGSVVAGVFIVFAKVLPWPARAAPRLVPPQPRTLATIDVHARDRLGRAEGRIDALSDGAAEREKTEIRQWKKLEANGRILARLDERSVQQVKHRDEVLARLDRLPCVRGDGCAASKGRRART